jgi:hypothetical protein
MLADEIRNHLHTLVLSAIVDDDDFKTVFIKTLLENTLNAWPDILFNVVYRYDDAKWNHGYKDTTFLSMMQIDSKKNRQNICFSLFL